jgi:hypothetical protein
MSAHDARTMTPPPAGKPYPPEWDAVAEIRTFRAAHAEWEKLAGWTADMRKHGYRLLRVTSDGGQIVAVYGKSRRPGGQLP